MKQIFTANALTLGILGKAKQSDNGYRMFQYCVSTPVDEGMLLFNILTRELLLLTEEEYDNRLQLPDLRDKWFVVPQETDDKKLTDTVRWVLRAQHKEPEHITTYTILTTTDCNARCFYCFEKGRARFPMSEETACKTADFIKSHCGGKKVKLVWFGGEPLYNDKVIDIICDELRDSGIEFHSEMFSNGYLFDDEMAKKAANRWNLKAVAITLDGTEDVYNRCKAFIYEEGSAYQVVMNNIGRLQDNGIMVSIRLNMDFHNVDDLNELIEILAQRFADKKRLSVYSYLIFDDDRTWDQRYTLEQWEDLYEAQHKLETRLDELGIAASRHKRLSRNLPQNHCRADTNSSIVILPDGNLSMCEHYSDKKQIGHLDSPERDQAVLASFRERCEELPECAACFYYPECIRLKQCAEIAPCIPPERVSIRRGVENAMRNEYRIWKKKTENEG